MVLELSQDSESESSDLSVEACADEDEESSTEELSKQPRGNSILNFFGLRNLDGWALGQGLLLY